MQTRTLIKIRGYHLDLYGHVNNARYLEFLEEGRWDFLEQQVGIATFTGSDLGLAVVNININYRRGAYVNQVIEVVTSLSRIGSKSAVMHQEVLLKGTDVRVADADVTFVVTDQQAKKTVPLQGELRQVLEQWQMPPR
jgi:thioesterase III